MPALGITITERAIRHARETMTEGEFRRAYLNQQTRAEDRVISQADWDAACRPDVQPDGKVVFSVDCNPERTWASIAVADQDGNVELVDHERGTGWVVSRTQQLTAKWNARVAVDPAGPAASFIPELLAEHVKVVEVGGKDLARACGAFYDGCAERTVRVRLSADLDEASAGARKRPTGDAWVWTRKSSLVDISPLVAATVAYWAARRPKGPAQYVSLSEV